jgi:uncharacterized protein
VTFAARVVLDTNVILSGLAYPTSIPGKILEAWRNGSVEVVLSTYILDELRRVLPRLSHRHGLNTAEMDTLIDSLALMTEIIEPEPADTTTVRDPKDGPILATLLQALADYKADTLITSDKDLLTLADRYPILTPAAFWERHGTC